MIETRPRARSRLRWFALVGMCISLLTSAASASAHSGGLYRPLDQRQGMIASAPSTGQISRTLEQRTGYATGQVTTRNVCPAPANPGRAQCAAQVLVTRSAHQIIQLSAGAHQRPELTGAAGVGPAPATPAYDAQYAPSAYTPGYLQEAYDLSWLSANRGAGDTVAIVDAGYDAEAASDLATFRNQNGLSSCPTTGSDPCFSQVNEYGSSAVSQMPAPADADWQLETTLDIDAVSSICPNCNILLVENAGGDADFDTAEQTAANLGAEQISNSFTEGVPGVPAGSNDTFPGVLTVASAGDSGYTGSTSDNYPAAYPGVVAAGGTTLAQSGTSAGRGFGESVWNQSGEDQNPYATGSGCDTYEPKPAYQTDVGCAGRAYNDISADADPQTGLEIYNAGQWELMGGTSLSSPLIAAYAALIGVHSDSAQWTYADAADLFDPSTGNDQDGLDCLQPLSYICDAGVGYDGPTGNGSISGTVVPGAPGIGGGTGPASVSDTSASVVAGVFPNGLSTAYYWQYGPTGSYGSQTATTNIGAGQGVVGISDTLPGLAPLSTYHFRLVATNADGTVYGYDEVLDTQSGGVTAVPALLSAPLISGAPVPGHTLTAYAGSWNPAPGSFTYQWQRSTDDATFTNIAGQTGVAYQVSGADLGDYLHVKVTATDAAGQSSATSAPSAQVMTLVPSSITAPTVTGTAATGQTLTAHTGQWSPAATAGCAYQWQRSADGNTWTNITGATAATYTVQSADSTDDVRVQVTASDSAGAGPPATSAPTVIPIAPVNTAAPTVSGTAQRLAPLTATNGQWRFSPTSYTDQWQVSDDAGNSWDSIENATGQTYTPGQHDEGDEIRVQVTATNAIGVSTANSAATAVVQPNPPYTPTTPTIGPTAAIGQTLTIANGTFAPSDVGTITYQWQRSVPEYQRTDIPGQTFATYTPTPADVGDQIDVQLTASNVDGSTTVTTDAVTVSAPAPVTTTQPVTTPLPLAGAVAQPTAIDDPTLTGPMRVGQTLTSQPATWTGSPTSAVVQIIRCASPTGGCAAVAGASYTLTNADVGAYFYALGTASNAAGTSTQRQAAADYGPVRAVTTTQGFAQTATAKITKTGSTAVKISATQYATAHLTAVKHSKKRKLELIRAAGITGPMTGWACQSTGKKKCLAQRALTSSASWITTLAGPLKITITLG